MNEANLQFPEGFMWGTSTSSHQVEGNNTNNNWHAWEEEPGRILEAHRSGLACDWWGGRWAEDLDRAAASGQTAHRMSVEWSRVQPAPDKWDDAALDYYRQMIKGMVDRGLVPIVTLHHFTHPLWVSELGGWESSETPKYLYEYARRVVTPLKEYVALWCTINEPNVIAAVGYLDGAMPPGVSNMGRAFVAMENLARTHVAAYQAIHEIQPEGKAGLALAYRGMHAARPWSPLDRQVAKAHSHLFNEFFARTIRDGKLRFLSRTVPFTQARGTQDFLGVNYYTEDVVAFNFNRKEAFGHHSFPDDAEISPNGLIANRPEGLFRALRWASGFGVPVLVTENGVEDGADQLRPRYLAQHIHQLWRAVDAGVAVHGYFHWSSWTISNGNAAGLSVSGSGN